MGEDNINNEQIESIYRKLADKIKPTFDDAKESYINFKKSINACKNSPLEERPHHLADADRHSKKAIELLNEIIKIAQRTENPDLIINMKNFIKQIQNERIRVGLTFVVI